ncbi:hypothetical protein [Oligoflexus sp.]|uniref:hypothetical protein n=1 Tax=Oligoflexus sp. TaxID=1971216 RepID=UPI002D77AB6B|nr:hypothetical protein [Oligoflexus sp.]
MLENAVARIIPATLSGVPMTAAEFVWKILQEHLDTHTWRSLSEKCGVAENTLRNIEKGFAKFRTLVIVVGNLLGEHKRSEFLIEFAQGEPTHKSEVETAKRNLKAKSSPMPLEEKFAELYMCLASDEGMTEAEILQWLSHRARELEDLREQGVLHDRNGRLSISDWSTSGNRSIKKLKMKLVALDSTDNKYRRGEAFSSVYRLDLKGYDRHIKLIRRYQAESHEINRQHGSPTGIPVISGCILATSLPDQGLAEQIDNHIEAD